MTQGLGSGVPEREASQGPKGRSWARLLAAQNQPILEQNPKKNKKTKKQTHEQKHCRLLLAEVCVGSVGGWGWGGGNPPFLGVLRLGGQSSAPPPCRAPLPQILVRGRHSESSGILEFLKPPPSESDENISAGRSVETLKPRNGSDWLLETGDAMGVRTGNSSWVSRQKGPTQFERRESETPERCGTPAPTRHLPPYPPDITFWPKIRSPCSGTWDFALTLLLLPGGPCYTVSLSPGPGRSQNLSVGLGPGTSKTIPFMWVSSVNIYRVRNTNRNLLIQLLY